MGVRRVHRQSDDALTVLQGGEELMDQKYTVNLDDGTQQVWTGDLSSIPSYTEGRFFLRCAGGVLVNVAHIVSMVPVG
jgi:hypothetical protein